LLPFWQPTVPCQVSVAATVVPFTQVPLGVTDWAEVQMLFAGCEKHRKKLKLPIKNSMIFFLFCIRSYYE
jgi:hypothetical protein